MQSSSELRTVRKSMLYDQQKYLNNFFEIITRVSPAQFDFLTPFDLRGQTFRVNVEFYTYCYGQIKTPRITLIISFKSVRF